MINKLILRRGRRCKNKLAILIFSKDIQEKACRIMNDRITCLTQEIQIP